MILTYTHAEEDLLFAISYLKLPIEFKESDLFCLKVQEEEFLGVKNVLQQLISLCKCDPHDLDLLNDDVVLEILRMRKMSPRKVLVTLTHHKKETEEKVLPSNILLHNYLNRKFLTLADLVLFARVYKSIKEGMKYSLIEKQWFDEFQSKLLELMDFKEIEIIDFEILDIRVGCIKDIKIHENADSLYIEKVSIGNSEIQVISGLKGIVEMDYLKGNHFLFVINMKKSKLRGEISQGMILCGREGEKIEVIRAPTEAPGEKLYLSGEKRPVIRNFNVPKIDKKNQALQEFMAELKIKNGRLVFKGRTVLCDDKEVITDIKNGIVS